MSDYRNERAQLDAIDTGVRAGTMIGHRGRVHDAIVGSAVGVVIAGLLAVVVFAYPTGALWLVGPSAVIYGVGIGVAAALYKLRRSATSWLSARRYRVGFFLSIGLYAIGVVLCVTRLAFPLWFWIPYIVATSLPLVIASNLGESRVR